jgi:hypothetical protein
MTVANVEAILARLADGDPMLIVPALAAAAAMLIVVGAAGLLSGEDPIATRLATGVSRSNQAAVAPKCRCRPTRPPSASDG